MIENNAAIQQAQVSPNSNALSAEHYQTYEIALANDDILAGNDIAQIRSYAAYARAQAQAIHKTIAATNGIEDVAAIKQEALETEQTFARVGLYADTRIGELLRELPKGHGNRFSTTVESQQTKAQALEESGISTPTAYQLEQLAKNPEVVEAVISKATEEGRIVSRKQVLDAIKRQKQAEQERDQARKESEKYGKELGDAQREICALEIENDKLYERASEAKEPKVVTREVIPADYSSLKHERDLYLSDLQKLRKSNEDMRRELEKAKLLIGEKQRDDSAQWDIAALTTATNNYLRQYGGKAWAFDQFYRVDATTQAEFTKAINNLAAFAQNLAQMIREKTNE